jgi:hypothetical protein
MKQVSGIPWTNAASAGQLVGRIAAKRDEIWHLFRIDTVTLPDLCWADPRDLTAAQRVQDCRRFGGKRNVSRSPLATSAVPPRRSSAATAAARKSSAS